MKNTKTTLRCLRAALIIPMLALASCATDMIRVGAIDGPIERITARHDQYVRDDESLSGDEKEIYLRSSELLNRIIEEAKK